jgi:hypothetical protein
MAPHMFAHVKTVCSDQRYPKFKMYVSELILDSYKYSPVAYVKLHGMILPSLKFFLLRRYKGFIN